MISSTAILACSDVNETVTYYREVLGFDSSWTYGDPAVFGLVSKKGATLTFELNPELASKVRGHPHGFKVEEIDNLYAMHCSQGARFVSDIEDKPWGLREYIVEDLNGYHLRFSGEPSSATSPSTHFPDGVVIERRVPTSDEYAVVIDSSVAHDVSIPGLIESTWAGVVAISPNGKVIGVLRIMRDAPGWFSIWDVIVLPEWRAQRIGSAMMKEALEMIHESAPNAIVYLFTVKHGFYERLGFTASTVSMLRF